MFAFKKKSDREKAEIFARKTIKCANRMKRFVEEWERFYDEIADLEKEFEQAKLILPLMGESKGREVLAAVQSLTERVHEATNPFRRMGK